ncbi:hypothetical protein BC829DRAFT_387811, partial [Chytridium lagenaria]
MFFSEAGKPIVFNLQHGDICSMDFVLATLERDRTAENPPGTQESQVRPTSIMSNSQPLREVSSNLSGWNTTPQLISQPSSLISNPPHVADEDDEEVKGAPNPPPSVDAESSVNFRSTYQTTSTRKSLPDQAFPFGSPNSSVNDIGSNPVR